MPSYVNLLSCNASDPVYFVPWKKRIKPLRNYKIGMVMLFFLVNCILKVNICRSPDHHLSKKKVNILNHTVYISPGKIFETFA